MSKAERFIYEHTRSCSNELSKINNTIVGKMKVVNGYQPWLTPDQARRAVEIAREEIYDWLANHYRDYMYNPTGKKLEAFFGRDMITDLKQAIEDE